ncbi:hypothetical protein B0T18DRAFT_75690 [Schizothecium vesticola]|uniref:Uncharacterized protein n=1 Tax=Schizothecium vesticola TaxID=314040 RepID=A0AA40KAG3_9PEZI|nr:hypothetical protein B0T18DRAFT_75690 [Schizothecium vesticola]
MVLSGGIRHQERQGEIQFEAAKYYRLAEKSGNKTIGNTWPNTRPYGFRAARVATTGRRGSLESATPARGTHRDARDACENAGLGLINPRPPPRGAVMPLLGSLSC